MTDLRGWLSKTLGKTKSQCGWSWLSKRDLFSMSCLSPTWAVAWPPQLIPGEPITADRRWLGCWGCTLPPKGPGLATRAADLLSLLDLRQHHDRVALPLPHHPPEVLHGVRQRPLGGDEVVLLSVALGTGTEIRVCPPLMPVPVQMQGLA